MGGLVDFFQILKLYVPSGEEFIHERELQYSTKPQTLVPAVVIQLFCQLHKVI